MGYGDVFDAPVYRGSYKPLNPQYSEINIFTGYRTKVEDIGTTTNPQTANQIEEIGKALNAGIKTIELGALNPQIMEQIPKQHLKEAERLAKLTNMEPTFHAPLIDPAGFQENSFNESWRQEAERQFDIMIERLNELNPKGPTAITVHASNQPSIFWEKSREGEKEAVYIIDRDREMIQGPLKFQVKNYPDKSIEFTPDMQIDSINFSQWDQAKTDFLRTKRVTDEMLQDRGHGMMDTVIHVMNRLGIKDGRFDYRNVVLEGNKLKYRNLNFNKWIEVGDERYPERKGPQIEIEINPNEAHHLLEALKMAHLYEDMEMHWRSFFDRSYKDAFEWNKWKEAKDPRLKEYMNRKREAMEGLKEHYKEYNENYFGNLARLNEWSGMIDSNATNLFHMPYPNMIASVEDFALEKASETVGNSAFKAWKKFGDKAPIIALENSYPFMAFSRADSLKGLIEASRDKFIQNAIEEGLSKDKAKKAADKIIGATWDLGHINMLRASGYNEEELKKEAKTIAPFAKKVHLTDNFGKFDAHLVPGMGNVPIKEMMAEFEKAGFKGKKIVEAGGFMQQFKIAQPAQYYYEALGSPLYEIISPPYWNQIAMSAGNYFSGFGDYLPQQHFNLYGSSFMQLPRELGGEVTNDKNRFSGTPNQ